LNGRGAAATQGATPLAQGYNKNVTGYPYSPAKAKELLAAAGYANGLTLSADITVGSFPADNLIYQSVKSDLAKVGVTLNYRTVTFGQWLPAYNAYSWTSDMLGLSWNTAPRGDAARPYENFVCKPQGAFYCDAAQSALLKSAGVEFDSKKRLAILQDLSAKVTASAPALYLVQQIDLYGIGKGTTGFSATNRAIAYENITVK
jgi:peptide/nickel transport system substrate-binding protein